MHVSPWYQQGAWASDYSENTKSSGRDAEIESLVTLGAFQDA